MRRNPATRYSVLLGVLLFCNVAPATGAVLPLVADFTTEAAGRCWWAAEPPAATGPVDLALASEPGVVSPFVVQPSGEVSRLLRRCDITDTNARNLAGLFGADEVLVGRLTLGSGDHVAWLGLHRAEVVLTATLLKVGSGAVVRSIELRATRFGRVDPINTMESAVEALAVNSSGLLQGTARTTLSPVDTLAPVVIVDSTLGAGAYIAFLEVLRTATRGVVDVREAWATEGLVAVAIAVDEGSSIEEVFRSIRSLPGRVTGRVAVVETRDMGSALYVRVEPAELAPDAPAQ